MPCIVPRCPRRDGHPYAAFVGGERVLCPLCPPHAAEYRADEFAPVALLQPIQ